MGRMVRKQVYITKGQEQRLKECAERLGVTEAELVRRGIEAVTEQDIGDKSLEQHIRELEPLAELRADETEWEAELRFMKAIGELDAPQKKRTWTRDELYEERFARYAR